MVWTFNGIYINGLTLWLLCKEDNLHSFTNIFLYLKFNHNLNIPLCSQNHFNFYIYPIGVFTIQTKFGFILSQINGLLFSLE